MNKLIQAAKDVVTMADDTGCDGNLTVTSKTSVERLKRELDKLTFKATKAPQTLKNPLKRALSVWKCPSCKKTRKLQFDQLSDVGTPMCDDDCRNQLMDLVALVIDGQTAALDYVSCAE
jgi:hypothetical protein